MEPTQKPEPSVSLATRLAREVGRGIDPDGAPCGQWVEMEGILLLLLFPIRGRAVQPPGARREDTHKTEPHTQGELPQPGAQTLMQTDS